jgi:hypothetical protein
VLAIRAAMTALVPPSALTSESCQTVPDPARWLPLKNALWYRTLRRSPFQAAP